MGILDSVDAGHETGILPSKIHSLNSGCSQLNAPSSTSNLTSASKSSTPSKSLSIVNVTQALFPMAQKKAEKLPRLELEKDKDWVVENYKHHKDILQINGARMTQNIQVRCCEDATVKVENKVNNVIIESCKKTNIVLAGLISSIELVHCDSVKLQVMGACPSVNMDNCNGVTLYVGKLGKDVSITSSKSSDMNISFPTDDAEEDWIEVPIPQQFVHHLNERNEIVSKVSDLYR